ncbi:GDP-mannose transporter [Spinellus fusiger]|nr:GDP-mannose transporter [Spinellus fusiger]
MSTKPDYKILVNEEPSSSSSSSNPTSSSSSNSPPGQTSSIVTSSLFNPSPGVRAALPIASYCCASILMTVTNKYVLSGYEFNMNFLLLTVQNIVTVTLLQTFKFLNLIKYREFDKDEARKWMPIACYLVAMIYTGSKALQYLRIPIYTIFKNLTIILIAYGEVIWFGGNISSTVMISFALMIFSSVIAGWAEIADSLSTVVDLEITLFGYFWMATNCLSSASFVLYMRKRIKLTNFKDFDTVYYNNMLSIPLLIIPSLLFEDWSAENLQKNFPADIRQQIMYAMVFSGVSAFVMSYASAWCVRTTSSTTYSMVGALNKLPLAASGILFFGDPATLANVAAIGIGFIAGLVYSYGKTVDNRPKGYQPQSIPMSVSSQSAADAAKAPK